MALKSDFGWVLSGAVSTEKQHCPKTCCLVTTGTGSGTGQGSQLEQSSTPFKKGSKSLKSGSAFGQWYMHVCATT